MLDRITLYGLKESALQEDWSEVGTKFLDLSLEAKTEAEKFLLEAIAHYVRLRDGRKIAATVNEILNREPRT